MDLDIPDYITLAIPVLIICVIFEAVVCLIKGKEYYRLNDSISNLSAGIYSQVVTIFSKLFFLIIYIYIYEHYRIYKLTGIEFFNFQSTGIMLWFISGLLVDHNYYWFHRLSHEINFLWGTHVPHHSSEEYNLTVALRQGMIQGFFSFPFQIILAVIGITPVMFFVQTQIHTLYQFWIHTRLVKHLPWPLEAILMTPSHHRVHHGINYQYIDKNHGGYLIIWDKLFGTFEPEGDEVVYGITKPLGNWNPVKAQLYHFIDTFKLSLTFPGLMDKIKIWFKEPGWLPDSFERKPASNRSVKTWKKFGKSVSKPLQIYTLINFIITILALDWLAKLDQQGNIDLWVKLLVGIFMLFTLFNLAGILDLKRWAPVGELIRIVILVDAAVYFYTINMIAPAIVAGICLPLLAIVFMNQKHFTAFKLKTS